MGKVRDREGTFHTASPFTYLVREIWLVDRFHHIDCLILISFNEALSAPENVFETLSLLAAPN